MKIYHSNFFAIILFQMILAVLARADNVVVEAESFTEIEAPMVSVTNAVVSGAQERVASCNAFVSIAEKAGNPPQLNKGFARYEIDIPVTGEYRLWARVCWDGECSNSFTVQIDDRAPILFGEDMTFNVWHWVKYPVSRMAKLISLEKGPHVITFKNREDGVALDQFLLAPDKRFVPVGMQ